MPTHGCYVPHGTQPHVVNVLLLGKGPESREMLQATQADSGPETNPDRLHLYVFFMVL